MYMCAQLGPTLCDPMACSLPGSLSMEFSQQEYWYGLPFATPGSLPELGTEPTPLASLTLAGGFFLPLYHLESSHMFIMHNKIKSVSFLITHQI